jgi:hypothetical protein
VGGCGPGATGPGGPEFALWSKESASKYSTSFVSSVLDLPLPSQPCVVLISGRTADNPRLLTECISAGCKGIYLEKPGAPMVSELQKMRDKAESVGITVLMGSTRTCASTCARLASLRRPCRGCTSPSYRTTRTSEFPLSFSFPSLLPFFSFSRFPLSSLSCVYLFLGVVLCIIYHCMRQNDISCLRHFFTKNAKVSNSHPPLSLLSLSLQCLLPTYSSSSSSSSLHTTGTLPNPSGSALSAMPRACSRTWPSTSLPSSSPSTTSPSRTSRA